MRKRQARAPSERIRITIVALASLALACASSRAGRRTVPESPPTPFLPHASRTLDPAMERYFNDTIVSAGATTSKLIQSLGYRCDSWIPMGDQHGVFGPGGLAPRSWSVRAYCRPAPPGDALAVTVSLATEPVELNTRQGETALAQGADFLLFHRFGCDEHLTLAAGAMRAPGQPSASGVKVELARPRAVEVSIATYRPGELICAKEEPIPSELQLIQRLDPRPLVAFIEGLPPPPPIVLPVPDPNAVPPTESEHSATEQEIVAELLDQLTGDARRLVIDEKTPPYALAGGALRNAWPDVDPAAVVDFNARNAKPAAFPAGLHWRVPLEIVSAARTEELFSHRDGWQRFYRAFPGSNGIISISAIGLSRDRTQAIVVVSRVSDPLAGSSMLFVLQHDARGWHTLYEQLLWVS